MTKTYRRGWWLLAAIVSGLALFGCGSGGGGAPPADVQGKVLLVTTGSPPNPAATVNIGGSSIATSADGTFVLRGVSSASTQISITGTGIKTLTQKLPTLKANSVNDLGSIYVVDTTSDYTATTSGKVVRADTQAALQGATVLLNGQATTTDATGAFSFSNLPVGLGGPGIQVGLITAQGFEDKPIIIDPPLGKSPPNNDLGNIPISPPVGGIPGGPTDISGKISLQGMSDFSGTTVTLINKTTGATLGSGTTGSDGAFGFWVVAGTYTVKADHTGFKSQSQDVNLARPDQPQTVNMTLTP